MEAKEGKKERKFEKVALNTRGTNKVVEEGSKIINKHIKG